MTPELEEFAQQIADAVESFLVALQAMSREENPGTVVPLLLVEVSQILFAGARLGAQQDFTPSAEYQPDVGPDPDLDAMRLRLARLLDAVDTYTYNFDPYDPEIVEGQLSDDLTGVATDLANGLRHHRAATWPRRCGGGSTPTSPTGATWPAPPCARCSPWSPTTGWTSTSRARARTSPPPRPCWTPASPFL